MYDSITQGLKNRIDDLEERVRKLETDRFSSNVPPADIERHLELIREENSPAPNTPPAGQEITGVTHTPAPAASSTVATLPARSWVEERDGKAGDPPKGDSDPLSTPEMNIGAIVKGKQELVKCPNCGETGAKVEDKLDDGRYYCHGCANTFWVDDVRCDGVQNCQYYDACERPECPRFSTENCAHCREKDAEIAALEDEIAGLKDDLLEDVTKRDEEIAALRGKIHDLQVEVDNLERHSAGELYSRLVAGKATGSLVEAITCERILDRIAGDKDELKDIPQRDGIPCAACNFTCMDDEVFHIDGNGYCVDCYYSISKRIISDLESKLDGKDEEIARLTDGHYWARRTGKLEVTLGEERRRHWQLAERYNTLRNVATAYRKAYLERHGKVRALEEWGERVLDACLDRIRELEGDISWQKYYKEAYRGRWRRARRAHRNLLRLYRRLKTWGYPKIYREKQPTPVLDGYTELPKNGAHRQVKCDRCGQVFDYCEPVDYAFLYHGCDVIEAFDDGDDDDGGDRIPESTTVDDDGEILTADFGWLKENSPLLENASYLLDKIEPDDDEQEDDE